MNRTRTQHLLQATLFMLLSLGMFAAPAQAAMVGTDNVLSGARHEDDPGSVDRDRLIAALGRDDVRKELREMGVDPDDARARVERMTDAEVAELQGRIDSLPAGGAVSTVELLLIIILVLLIA